MERFPAAPGAPTGVGMAPNKVNMPQMTSMLPMPTSMPSAAMPTASMPAAAAMQSAMQNAMPTAMKNAMPMQNAIPNAMAPSAASMSTAMTSVMPATPSMPAVGGGKEVTIYKNAWPLGIGKRVMVGEDDGKNFEDQCREFLGPHQNEKIRLYCFSSLGDARVLPNSVKTKQKLRLNATTHQSLPHKPRLLRALC